MLTEIVLALLAETTIAALYVSTKTKKKEATGYFCSGAILAYALLFFHLFIPLETVILETPNPITGEGVQAMLIVIITLFQIIGFYSLAKGK